MSRSTRRTTTIASAATVILLLGCSSTTSEGSDGDLPRVATLTAYPALPSAIAEGFFDESFGYDASDMHVDFVASGTDGAQAVAAGHSDIAIGGYDPAVLIGDTNVRLLALSESSPDTHAILVSPDSDISSLEDLHGATIGGYSSRLPSFLSLLFTNEEIPPESVNYTQVENDSGLSALTSGAIDAWYTFDPFYAQAELQDLAVPIVTGEGWYLNTVVVLSSERYLQEHPEEVEAFLRGFAQATTWLSENGDQAAAYLVEETGLATETAQLTMSRRNYEVAAIEGEYRQYMEELNQVYLDTGLISELPDMDTVIVPEPLERATSESH